MVAAAWAKPIWRSTRMGTRYRAYQEEFLVKAGTRHIGILTEIVMTAYQNDNILYLRRKDVELPCRKVDSVAVIREVFRMHASGQTILPDEAYLAWTNDQGESVRSLNM